MYNPEPVLRFLEAHLGSPYVYGGTGQKCTPKYRAQKALQYPAMKKAITDNCSVLSGRKSSCAGCKHRDKGAYDCAQLVRKAYATLNLTLPSGASSQWKKAALWAYQGRVTQVAANHVCVLFREDEEGDKDRPMTHVGISLGNGQVIDARNHRLGVIKTRFTAYPWTHFAIPTGFLLPEGLMASNPAAVAPAKVDKEAVKPPFREQGLRIGESGERVLLLQTQLLRLGYYLPRFGADGKYGRETAAAVRAFQKVTGLPADGEANPPTLKRLFPKPDPLENIDLTDENW